MGQERNAKWLYNDSNEIIGALIGDRALFLETEIKQSEDLPMSKAFIDVDFVGLVETDYEVQAHEVYLAFNNDDDAQLFRDWWAEEGSLSFGAYYERQHRSEPKPK